MERFDDIYKDRSRMQAPLLRAVYAARFVKDDNGRSELKRYNISHILTVAGSMAPAYPHDFKYKVIEVADREETDLAQYFDECIDFIDDAKRSGGGVLVHCFVGRSRSVTIVLAYLIKKRGMTVFQALEYVRSKRPQASPNAGFIKQLHKPRSVLIEVPVIFELAFATTNQDINVMYRKFAMVTTYCSTCSRSKLYEVLNCLCDVPIHQL